MWANLAKNTTHLLVAGMQRSGKTTFLQSLILSMMLKNNPDALQFILIAGSSDGFIPFENAPHLISDIMYSNEDIENTLQYAISEMEDRTAIRLDDRRAQFPKMVIVIDEIDGIIAKAEKGIYSNLAKLVIRLAKESPKYNMSLVLGTQSAAPSVVPSGVLSMIQTRVCLQVASTKYSRVIIDNPDGAKLTGLGDLFYYDGGHLTRAQGYYMDTDEIEERVNDLGDFVPERSGTFQPHTTRSNHVNKPLEHVPERSGTFKVAGFQPSNRVLTKREQTKMRVKELTRTTNLSQQAIANEIGISKTQVNRLLHEDD